MKALRMRERNVPSWEIFLLRRHVLQAGTGPKGEHDIDPCPLEVTEAGGELGVMRLGEREGFAISNVEREAAGGRESMRKVERLDAGCGASNGCNVQSDDIWPDELDGVGSIGLVSGRRKVPVEPGERQLP